jgi:hypothetical protein
MWTTDSSHFIPLLTTAHKYGGPLAFIEMLSVSPFHPHAIASNSYHVVRKFLVWIPLDVLMKVGSLLG